MQLDKYSIDGKVVGSVELSDSVFNSEINDDIVYQVINAYNANLRQGTHKTKGRSEVSGGGAKPWRQKGTGRARQGTIRAPQWKGGGVVFGPVPRSYKVSIPRKIKDSAYRSIFSLKAKQNSIIIVEDFEVKNGKTKEVVSICKSLNFSKGVMISAKEDAMLKRAAHNIADIKLNSSKRLSGRDIFYAKQIVLTESAVKEINEKFSKGE